MIVDASAILAVLLEEPEAAAFTELLVGTANLRMSTATYVELINVCDRRVGPEAVAKAEQLIARTQIELVAFTAEQAQWARHAQLTYGAGRHRLRHEADAGVAQGRRRDRARQAGAALRGPSDASLPGLTRQSISKNDPLFDGCAGQARA